MGLIYCFYFSTPMAWYWNFAKVQNPITKNGDNGWTNGCTTPNIRFLFVAPHLWIGLPPGPPRDRTLALLLTLGSTNTWYGDSHPTSYGPCPAHTRASLDRFNAQRSKKPTADAFPSSSGNHATEAGQVHAQLAPTDATKPTTITKGKHLKARTDLRNRKRSNWREYGLHCDT